MSIIYRSKNIKNDFNVDMLTDLEIENAIRDVEVIEIPGRDGDIVIDNGRYKTVNYSPKFVMWRKSSFATFEDQQNAVSNWLSPAFGYSSLITGTESKYTYMARVVDKIKIQLVDEVSANIEINFAIHPIKYLTTGLSAQNVINGATINNIGKVASKPTLTLTGTGNITLNVNGKDHVFKNITDGIIIDGENKSVTNLGGNQTQWDKVYTWPLPSLKTGSNVISWDNSSFLVSLIPKWGELI